MDEAHRIEELEGALKDVIDYLRRLPLHPQTSKTANAAEMVLTCKPVAQTYSTTHHHSAGPVLLSATVKGLIITAKTVKYPTWPDHKDALYQMLLRGIQLPPLKIE